MEEKAFGRHWREIIDSMNDGLIIVTPDGVIRMVNRALERLTGYTRDELVGQTCSIFNCDVCELARSESRDKWCRLFDIGQSTLKRCLIARKDGSYVSMYKRASLLRDKSGEVLGAVETLTDISELERLDLRIKELSMMFDSGFEGIVGASAPMRKIFSIIEKAAQSDAPVIIFGASGTGKELVARAIHERGRRRDGPYIQLNCAALNESLLESELFGHVKGAFTGAYRHRQGRFEAAHSGDIFLDEIGDIPLSIQVKLLRVLETKQFERVGDHRPVVVDVRVIAATNRDLPQLISDGRFREDLYFRINVIPIHLPSLRDRMEDVPLLVEEFIRRLCEKTGKDISGLSPEAMRLFMNYSWPGNVRELKSALEYAFVIAERGAIDIDHLPAGMVTGKGGYCTTSEWGGELPDEKLCLLSALREAEGNQSRAARILGVSRVTVWNRMKKYGIDPKRIPG